AYEALADHGTHRAAHEAELERTGDHRHFLQPALHHNQRVLLAGRLLRGNDAIPVFLAVTELERVHRTDRGADFLAALRIKEHLQPLARAYAHVVTAFRADMQVPLHFSAIEHGIAGVAFGPHAFRHAAALLGRGIDAGGYKLSEPVH